jgi:hypothetical protein
MKFQFNDGGRAAAGYKGKTSDCVVRSIAIATEQPYQEVYDAINLLAQKERVGKRQRDRSSSRDGVYRKTYEKYLRSIGWVWVPCMQIGSGCRVHLVDGELPSGRLIVRLSKHLTCVIDGVIHDLYNPERSYLVTDQYTQRIVHRCVYGYFRKA